MTEEGLLDLIDELRTMCQELQKAASKETEKAKLEVDEAIAEIEAEFIRRELPAQS